MFNHHFRCFITHIDSVDNKQKITIISNKHRHTKDIHIKHNQLIISIFIEMITEEEEEEEEGFLHDKKIITY